MHKILSLIFLTLLSLPLIAATTIRTKIHDLDMGQRPGDDVLVMLGNGELLRVAVRQVVLINQLHAFKLNQHRVEILLNDARKILKITDIEATDPEPEEDYSEFKSDDFYIPTVMSSMEEAAAAFELMVKNSHPNSQCYNRAQVWTHEWRKNQNYFTSKVWVFFTRKYVRKHPKFIWWFHVAPMVHVLTPDGIKERMMDRKYFKGPRTVKAWTDFFVQGRPNCPVVDNFSEHSLYQDNEYCFLQKSSMYFYNPVDLDNLEKTGAGKISFHPAEIKEAYFDAFNPRPVKKESEVPGEANPTPTTPTPAPAPTPIPEPVPEPIPEVKPEETVEVIIIPEVGA